MCLEGGGRSSHLLTCYLELAFHGTWSFFLQSSGVTGSHGHAGLFIWGLGIKTFVEQSFLLTVPFLHCTFFWGCTLSLYSQWNSKPGMKALVCPPLWFAVEGMNQAWFFFFLPLNGDCNVKEPSSSWPDPWDRGEPLIHLISGFLQICPHWIITYLVGWECLPGVPTW